MSATIMSDVPMPMVLPPGPGAAGAVAATPEAAQPQVPTEIEFVKCDCCGLTEECTPSYIHHVRERYNGHWICGLCAEAIKDEIVRSERLISTEEAMASHTNFCRKFKASSGPPPNPTIHLISAMRQILRRSLDSPRGLRSTPSSPTKMNVGAKGLTRSESCFPTLTGSS